MLEWYSPAPGEFDRWVLRSTEMKLLTSALILVLSCGSLLLVAQNQKQTVLLNKLNAANFSTKISKPENAGDMKTMALSLLRQ